MCDVPIVEGGGKYPKMYMTTTSAAKHHTIGMYQILLAQILRIIVLLGGLKFSIAL